MNTGRALTQTRDDQYPELAYGAGPKPDGVLAIGEPGPLHPATFFVVSIVNEVSHHGTQICVLRDLYAHRR